MESVRCESFLEITCYGSEAIEYDCEPGTRSDFFLKYGSHKFICDSPRNYTKPKKFRFIARCSIIW